MRTPSTSARRGESWVQSGAGCQGERRSARRDAWAERRKSTKEGRRHLRREQEDELVCRGSDCDGAGVASTSARWRWTRGAMRIDITLDSGAGASCWPEKFMRDLPRGPKARGTRFKTTHGAELKCYGTKRVRFAPMDDFRRDGGNMTERFEIGFRVTDTTKPLAAMAFVKMGNRIVPESGQSYSENPMGAQEGSSGRGSPPGPRGGVR